MPPPVYGFSGKQAFDRNTRAMKAAEQLAHTPGHLPHTNNFISLPQPAHVYLKVTHPKVAGDRRNVYPAVLEIRDPESESEPSDWYRLSELGDDDPEGTYCVAITPNGEVLRKNSRYEGRVIGHVLVVAADVPQASGTLTVKINDVAGTITLDGVVAAQVGDVFDFTWDAGSWSGAVVGAVTNLADPPRTVVEFSGGVGTAAEIPEAGALVTARAADPESPHRSEVPVVQVDCSDGVEIIRTTGTRNSDGDYLGYVQEFDPETNNWVDGEEVWVRNAN